MWGECGPWPMLPPIRQMALAALILSLPPPPLPGCGAGSHVPTLWLRPGPLGRWAQRWCRRAGAGQFARPELAAQRFPACPAIGRASPIHLLPGCLWTPIWGRGGRGESPQLPSVCPRAHVRTLPPPRPSPRSSRGGAGGECRHVVGSARPKGLLRSPVLLARCRSQTLPGRRARSSPAPRCGGRVDLAAARPVESRLAGCRGGPGRQPLMPSLGSSR